MQPKIIDTISYLASSLWSIVHRARPSVPFTKKKLKQYADQLKSNSPAQIKLKDLLASGEVAIIPIGFRCFTLGKIKEKLDIKQASLPFNNGFFSPKSVANVIINQNIQLSYDDNGLSHKVCIKTEDVVDTTHGRGIKFEKSSYNKINAITINKNIEDINKYLDSSCGYYTLDQQNKFILAHYNWHEFADITKSKGIANPAKNLQIINEILNKRIKRMIDLCNAAKHIFFVFSENQNYDYIQIDDIFYSLKDFSTLEEILRNTFPGISTIIDIQKIKGAEDLLQIIAHNQAINSDSKTSAI